MALAVFLTVGQATLSKSRTPRVVLLGAGDRISTLIVSGNARMLITAGTNGRDLLNAFAVALPLTSRHIDVLVITGDKTDLPAASAARTSIDASKIFVLNGGLATSLDDLKLNASALISGGKRIALSPGVFVTIEQSPTDESGKSAPAWQAVIAHGKTRVRIVSDPQRMTAFRDRRASSALVIAAKPAPSALPGSFLSLAVPASVADPSPLISEKLGAIPVVKVENGRATSLTFTADGLKLPRSARPIAKPAGQTGDPPRAAMDAVNSAWIASRRPAFVSTS